MYFEKFNFHYFIEEEKIKFKKSNFKFFGFFYQNNFIVINSKNKNIKFKKSNNYFNKIPNFLHEKIF
jgi:hypothetical protein